LFATYETCCIIISPVTISLFPTSIDLDPIFEKDRDLDRFRFSNRASQSVVLNTSGAPPGVTLDRRVMQNRRSCCCLLASAASPEV